MRTPTRILADLVNRLLVFDLGLTSLRSAIRGTTSVVLSFFILSYFARLFHQPPTLAFLGVLISMMGSIAINDPTRKQQMISMAILPFPAAIAFAASIALGPWPQIRLAGFLVVTFFAVSLRRFGFRWTGLGIVTFMAYFSPLFFPIHAESIPWVIAAVFTATIVSSLIRFWIFPDRIRRLIRFYIRGFQIQYKFVLNHVVSALKEIAEAPQEQRKAVFSRRRFDLQAEFVRLNEISLTLEQYLENHGGKYSTESLQTQTFEQELSLRYLLDAIGGLAPFENVDRKLLLALAEALRETSEQCFAKTSAHQSLERIKSQLLDFSSNSTIAEVEDAIAKLFESTRRAIQSEAQSEAKEEVPVRRVQPGGGVNPKNERLHISTRQAIQATLATALASFIGASVSPQRWYWASVTAFMVFVGASRGETLIRASLRVLGTVGGLVFGYAFASAFSGHRAIEWSMIIVCVFFAIFCARMAFGFWTTGLFTLIVAILFDLLGTFSQEILILRLEETVVGSVIGAIVGAYVLPSSTTGAVRLSLSKLLRTMGATFEELPGGTPSPFSRRALVKWMREMDRNLMELRAAAAPIVGPGSFMRRDRLLSVLHDSAVMVHFVRHLVTYKGPLEGLSEDEFRSRCELLAKEFRKQADQLETENQKKRVSKGDAVSLAPTATNYDAPVHWLERVEQILKGLERRKF